MPYKLLLADDSVTIQRVIELTFADEDVMVTAVGDGEQAIERILNDRPDIVLADVGMPKQDGYEVAAFIKNDASLEHIPVLLLTGAFEPVDEERARAVRCDGVLAKPFEPQLLISRVKELLMNVPQQPAGPAAAPEPVIAIGPDAAQPVGVEILDDERKPEETTDDEAEGMPAHATFDGEPALEVEALNLRAESPAAQEGTLDDYFDRLDAAFAHLTGNQTGREAPGQPARQAPADLWTAALHSAPTFSQAASDAFGGTPTEAPDSDRRTPFVFTRVAAPAASSSPADDLEALAALSAVPVTDAFASLLEAEREKGPDVVHSGHFEGAPAVVLPGTAVTQAFVDDVARRVLERIGDPAFREVVAQIVSATAERLMREEIERIKSSM